MHKMSHAMPSTELSWDRWEQGLVRGEMTVDPGLPLVLIPAFILVAGYFHFIWAHGQPTKASLSSMVSTSHKDHGAWTMASLTC